MDAPEPTPASGVHRWHWCARAAKVAIPPLVLIAALEVGLALAGVSRVRYAGLPGSYFVPMAPEAGLPAGYVRWQPRVYRIWKEPKPLFLREKPTNGLRIFCFGDSPVVGWPYDVGGFTDWMQSRIGAMLPDRAVEVVNAANPGWHATETRELLRECLEHQADLLLWMPGNSEWTPMNRAEVRKRLALGSFAPAFDRIVGSRIVGLLGRLDPMFSVGRRFLGDPVSEGDPSFSEEEVAAVKARFEEAVRGGVDDARRAGVPIVLCTPPRNLRESPPRSSYYSAALRASEPDRERWEAIFSLGSQHLTAERFDLAAARLEEAAAIDSTPAKLHYALGRAYAGMKDAEKAKLAFRRAVNAEREPTRPQDWTLEAIRRVAAEKSVPLVEVEEAFNARGEMGLAGNELLLDNVHPSLEGQALVGNLVMDALLATGWLPLRRELDVKDLTGSLATGLARQVNYNLWRGTCTGRFDAAIHGETGSPEWTEAYDYGKKILEMVPDDSEIVAIVAVLDAMAGRETSARSRFEQAMRDNTNVRLLHLTRYRTDEVYKKIVDAAKFDLEAQFALLSVEERNILRNRIAREMK